MDNGLTHFDSQGNAVMVDVSEKQATHRVAIASGKIKVNQAGGSDGGCQAQDLLPQGRDVL